MKDCLVITELAGEFCAAIQRLAPAIAAGDCRSAAEARDRYDGETVVFGNPGMIADALPDMPDVRWVQSSWAGVTPLIDHHRRDYCLTGLKGVFGAQMAEYVLGYLLARELKLLERLEAQRHRQWFTELSGTLSGKQLGIMGTGSIGRHIAASCRPFGLEISGFSRTGAPADGFDRVLSTGDLGEFLAPLDYLVCVLPDTPGTSGLLDAAALQKMRPDAYLINVGRSSILDEDALLMALDRRELAGALLDVFDSEPLPPDSRLWNVPHLTLTAHISAVSHPELIVPVFIDNFRRYRDGQPLNHVVDFAAGY